MAWATNWLKRGNAQPKRRSVQISVYGSVVPAKQINLEVRDIDTNELLLLDLSASEVDLLVAEIAERQELMSPMVKA